MRAHHGRDIFFAVLVPAIAWAQAPSADVLPEVEVTATRVAEPVDVVPADVTVISGDELRARGAHDLQSALALVAGTESPAGGDAGPAGAVPSFWGLHEFDAFLLVVDGIPWGGAFNPSIPTLDFNDVERVEVLHGSAPVIYGATAFVGVVQVIHYPAGKAADRIESGYGSYGTGRIAGSLALPQWGAYRHSLAASADRQQQADPRAAVNNIKLLYRGASRLAGGELRIDFDSTLQRQTPGSPAIFQGDAVVTPLDANYNPADARIDEHRYHLALAYGLETALGRWDTTLSYAHSSIVDVRGFLRSQADWTPDAEGGNADSMNQDRGLIDVYVDTHFSDELFDGRGDIVYGTDLLYGSGKQFSNNGEYCAFTPVSGFGPGAPDCPVLPAATVPPGTPPLGTTLDEINGINDRRAFVGQYVQLDWKPYPRWDVLAGLRLNETHERNAESHVDTADSSNDAVASDTVNRTRFSGMLGSSYQLLNRGADTLVAFADYRNTFKPAAIDFGPDVPTPAVLAPEVARSYEAGVKGHWFDRRLDYDASLFFLHFNNLVVADGVGGLANAGSELFSGIETETRWHFEPDLAISASFNYHNARYGSYVDGDGVQVDGNHVELSPHVLGALGLLYTPPRGFFATAVVNAVGSRYLDQENNAATSGYRTVDTSLGYRWRHFFVSASGFNLTDERKPVTGSEFGNSSFYLLQGRQLMAMVGANL